MANRKAERLLMAGAALLAGVVLLAGTPWSIAKSERAEMLWAKHRGGRAHKDGHELVLKREQTQLDTATGARTLQKDPKSLTAAKAQWELARLMQVYREGILDREDYNDAKAKIVAKVQGSDAGTRARKSGSNPGAALTAQDLKKGQALIAAMEKLKKDHGYVQKQLRSPWRQDKEGLKEKDKLLTRRMAKLEGALQAMKQSKSRTQRWPVEKASENGQTRRQRGAAQDFRDPAESQGRVTVRTTPASTRAHSRKFFSRQPPRESAAFTQAEVARALGTDAVFVEGADLMSPDAG